MFETIRMVLLGTINTYSKQVIIIRENSLLRTFRILKPGKWHGARAVTNTLNQFIRPNARTECERKEGTRMNALSKHCIALPRPVEEGIPRLFVRSHCLLSFEC